MVGIIGDRAGQLGVVENTGWEGEKVVWIVNSELQHVAPA
jgi:hypothetical protein